MGFRRVVGVDGAREAVEVARTRAECDESLYGRVEYIQGSVSDSDVMVRPGVSRRLLGGGELG